MKRALHILLILVLGTAIAACSDNKKERVSIYRGDRPGVGGVVGGGQIGGPGYPGGQQGASSSLGYIFNSGSTSGGTFQDRVDGFISGATDPTGENGIGYIDQQGTGVFFSGNVTLSNGYFNPYNNSSSAVSGGNISIIIYDSVAKNNGGYGVEIPMGNATGSVNGNQINITISDDFGTVTFSGGIDNRGYFSGEVSYANTRHWNGASPAQGTMGRFEINPCSLFQCQ